MRFFEFESREIARRGGIPVTDFGFATSAQEAREIAHRIGGPTVIKSQVLSGGRMKAGGVRFADDADEAAEHTEAILKLEIGGHMPRGVLVDPRADIEQEYYAGVVWDGLRKRPVMIFSPVGGIDIEQVAEEQPDRVGRRHFSTVHPFSDYMAKEVIASTGVSGRALTRITPILSRLARLFLQYDLTLAEINPLGELADGSFLALDAHMDMENEARPRQKALLAELGVGDEETRAAREPTAFELAGEEVDAMDHRGVAGNVTEFDGEPGARDRRRRRVADALRRRPRPRRAPGQLLRDRRQPVGAQGLRPGQARAGEAGRGQDRGDDVDRLQHAGGHRRPRRDQSLPGAGLRTGGEDRHLPHPGGLGGPGLQDPREVRSGVLRPLGVDARGGAAGRGEGRVVSILIDADTTFIVQGITGREAVNLTRECLDYGSGARIVGGVTPGRLGRDVHGVPVFDTVAQAVEHHGGPIHGSVVTVPPAFTKDAVLEAIDNGVKLIVIVTERIPRGDVAQMVELAGEHGARIIGPNCLGIIVPDVIKMGGIGGPARDAAKAYSAGPVGVISRSGGMTTEMSSTLTAAGLGQSTAVSIGGDAIIGSTYAELMPLFEHDDETQAIVIYTEPGGRMEAELARHVTEVSERKLPIVAFMAGRFMDEMPGMSFGHAGTIVEGKEDTATEKIARLEAAGITVAEEISEIPALVKERLGAAV